MPDDPLDELARSLRTGVGRELQEEAAEDELLSERRRLRHQDLAQALRAAMHSGDRVTANVGGMTLSHPLMSVGTDYLTMSDGEHFIDIRLAITRFTVEPRRQGGTSGSPAAHSFTARLAEHEQDETELELVCRRGDRVAGTLVVVAADHVVVEQAGGIRSIVPSGEIAAVLSRHPPRLGSAAQ
ncbi:MAG TPA: hypothetical protein VE173_11390 [Longimicrobiales bacterium]|nr:hypothetical protein [Longimicrobiales bacterium]